MVICTASKEITLGSWDGFMRVLWTGSRTTHWRIQSWPAGGGTKSSDVERKHGFISVPGRRDARFAGSDVEGGSVIVGAVVQFDSYFGANNGKPRARLLNLRDTKPQKDPVASEVMFGYVKNMQRGHCFTMCEELTDDVFVGRERFSSGDWLCLQQGQPFRFSLEPQTPKPKALHVEFVTKMATAVVVKYFGHYGFVRLPADETDIWFAATSVEGHVENEVPDGLVVGAEVHVEFFSRRDGQVRAVHVRCHSAPR